MPKGLIAFFFCLVLPLSGTLAAQQAQQAQQGDASKPDTNSKATDNSKAPNSKAEDKKNDTYTPSLAAKTQFMRETGYRNGRPGYVVAYRKPLACGGTDDTSNLLWLTTAEAKAQEKAQEKAAPKPGGKDCK